MQRNFVRVPVVTTLRPTRSALRQRRHADRKTTQKEQPLPETMFIITIRHLSNTLCSSFHSTSIFSFGFEWKNRSITYLSESHAQFLTVWRRTPTSTANTGQGKEPSRFGKAIPPQYGVRDWRNKKLSFEGGYARRSNANETNRWRQSATKRTSSETATLSYLR